MKSQENLERIVDDAELVEKWKKTRYGLQKKKDDLFAKLFGPPSDEGLRGALIDRLDGRLIVDFNGAVLDISVEWDDPWVALELHKVVLGRFFEQRRSRELGEIQETIQLLDQKHRQALAKLRVIVDKNRKLVSEKVELQLQAQDTPRIIRPQSGFRPSKISTPASMSPEQKAELERSSTELQSVQAEIARLQADHKQRLAAERDKLAEYQTQYGPQHPEIVKKSRYIELLSAQEAVPGSLLRRANSLEKLIKNLQQPPVVDEASVIRKQRVASFRGPIVDEKKTEVSPSQKELADVLFESELMTAEYREAEDDANRLRTQLANTRLELEATEAAFAYRYRLVKPPVFPKRPSKPQGLKLMMAGVLLSIFLGIALTVFVDIRSGLILESWQIDKIVNLPLLGEVDDSQS
ncbi:MAG: hypothetical protein JXX14_07670 [Deltaproteobacteria bacterium]|nr:hypothetical protein [Deltaproteobacteria bacterium]